MDNDAAPSEGSTQTTPAAPATNSPTSPKAIFGNDSSPEWVKTAGLQDAHTKGGQAPAATTAGTPPPVATTPAATPAPAPVAPSAPTALTIDHRALAQAIRDGNAPAPTGPSDDELSRQLGITHVTPEIYKQAFGVDGTPEQIKSLNDYGQGIAKQAVTIASVLMGREIQQLKDSFAPYTNIIQNQERERIKSEFFKKNVDLAGYEAVVTQQFQLAKASGKTFNSIEEAGNFVAEQTRSHLKSLGITPPAGGAANGQSPGKSVPQTRQMAPQSMGGKGNAAPNAAAPKNNHTSIWG